MQMWILSLQVLIIFSKLTIPQFSFLEGLHKL